MTINLTLLVVMGAMLAIGIYLILERSLTRVVLGIILISNGVNLLLL
jgi:multicomponent Na+:H+ antiporter subunit C